MKEDSILIEILSIGEKYLKKEKEIELKDLRNELKNKYPEDLIERALKLFYPENFKNYYGEGSWLSSDGHIRLLQYRSLETTKQELEFAQKSLQTSKENLNFAQKSLEASQNNLNLAKESLKESKKNLLWSKIAIWIAVFVMLVNVGSNRGYYKNGKLYYENAISKQDSISNIIIPLLEQSVKYQDSINHSLKKLDESILKNQNHNNNSLAEKE
ncbi:MAG: hypothetical protein LBI15_00390 [Dysgonamonadaceae bacterium]|jgi:hypothetical protein|nr:hypothetical protein [Dysgonamonadaceae bacterium]